MANTFQSLCLELTVLNTYIIQIFCSRSNGDSGTRAEPELRNEGRLC